MKIKQLILGIALTLALTLVIMLNQNQASAQTTSGISCGLLLVPQTASVVDQSNTVVCGKCTVYTVNAGWQPSQGIGAKYSSSVQNASGTVITCKSSADHSLSCNGTALNGTVSCPAPPADLSSTGTGTSTSTSSH